MGDITEQAISEPAVDEAADEQAFEQAFNASSKGAALPPLAEQPPSPEATPEAESKAAETPQDQPEPTAAPAAPPAPASPAPAADPFEGWPDAAKKAVQAVQALENELRITSGRVRKLQSDHDRAVAAAAAAKAAAPAPELKRSESYTKVAEALPEVLDTFNELLDERLKQQTPAAAPAPAEPADERSADEIRLDEGFPTWRQIAVGDEFKTWAAAQPDARVIQTTGDMVTFMGAITRFKADEAARSAAAHAVQQANALRTQRVDASLTPTRGAPRRPAATTYQSDDEAFAAGFRGE